MNCERCGNLMVYGAPHCETIKVQLECPACGNISNEYYTPEELQINELTAATGASLKDCRAALEATVYNLVEAEKLLTSKAVIDGFGRIYRTPKNAGILI